MWNIPKKIIEEADDEKLLNFSISQLTDPHLFLEKVKYLYSHLTEESTDILNFKDGRIFERISKPIIIGDEPIGRVWSFIDISERKKTEELLQNERTLFRTVIDIIPDAIYVKDVDGKKILANPKEVQFAGMICSGNAFFHKAKSNEFFLSLWPSRLRVFVIKSSSTRPDSLPYR